ncbi:TonB-dependent receptor [Olivibacter sp. SDN3]|uniref:TonB-dependent receptor n=1 Tax=Olivibacter sp. SDN3 TaxID=2764720 RepID=UPI001650E198|nr:TonB-dependent receptor [Olivibacter sp. SDN3]QNL48219.1 TonB-dependent receptor [Olivibacter sp. SDN3]
MGFVGKSLLFLAFFVGYTRGFVWGQEQLQGRVLDDQGKPLANVSVRWREGSLNTFTDNRGSFVFKRELLGRDTCTLVFSYIGKKTEEKRFLPAGQSTDLPTVILSDLSLALDQIEIKAKTDGGSTNSSLIIDREMLERYPSLSLNDLLNFLPNRRIAAPSLQDMQQATLRAAFRQPTAGSRNVQELNNAFGVSLIVDDIVMSNNANMQSRNAGIRGLNSANLSIPPSNYGDLSTTRHYSGESTFGGIDLRQIPTENIERIEVITGVPSVRYGDLNSGAIIVERQAGKAPAFFRMQLRGDATSYGFSASAPLPEKLGDLNFDLGYTNSYADNRDKIKQYNRVNGSLIWTQRWGGGEKWKHTFSATYSKIIDGVKKDPDDPQSPRVKYDNWNLNMSSRWSYQPSAGFFKRVGLNLGYSTSHQESYRDYFYNGAFVLYTQALETGVVEGTYGPGIYRAEDHIDGRPMNITGRLETYGLWHTGDVRHTLNLGMTADYSINRGRGRLADPSLPVAYLGGNFSDRYYDYSLIVPIWDYGFYAEDRFQVSISGRPLSVNAGVRGDVQNGFASFSPRTNINYRLSESLQLGLAYGLAFKAPGLAHRYPGPIFSEIVLLNAYNGREAESTSRIYVDRFDPPSEQLKPSRSQTLELTARWNKQGHNIALNLFHRTNSHGIDSYEQYEYPALPNYQAIPVPGEKPEVIQTGLRVYEIERKLMANLLRSQDNGIELLYNSPKYAPLATSLHASGGIYRSASSSNARVEERLGTTGTDPEDVIRGYFNPDRQISYSSNARVGTATHLPRLKLVFEFTADFQLMNYSKLLWENAVPTAYITRDYTEHVVDPFDPANPIHQMLYDRREQRIRAANETNLFVANFHFSMAKEIGERLRLSFNVYNFLDYQPRSYYEVRDSVRMPNSAPNFGAMITYKL